jgi:hypothetical protein
LLVQDSIWKRDERYATVDGIRRCWRKSSILPLHMNTNIDAELGKASIALSDKTLKKEDSDQLCELMTVLKLKATRCSLDCNKQAIALKDSFVAQPEEFTAHDYNAMIDNWICIEDAEEVMNAICEEEIEALESDAAKPAADENPEDDDEPDMEIDDDGSNSVSYVEAVEFLGKLRRSTNKLGVNSAATVHIDRFLKELHQGHAAKPRRDTTLHSFFSKK